MPGQTFYITTAIDYPNGVPHLGHVYEKIVTDTYARWYRLSAKDVYFVTGTDENGQKLAKAAAEAKDFTSTIAYVDHYADTFRTLCKDLLLTNNDFIRTTEDRHKLIAQDFWRKLAAKQDIYFDRYSGLYCLACEAFYIESQVEDKRCPHHGTQLQHTEEDGYFFRMSRYQDWIISFIRSHEDFIYPASARKEVLSRLEADGLKDLSVSRPNVGWGISVPDKPDHVIYTWFDALINYYAAIITADKETHRFWPADMHVIGKDITWFHTVIWPVMLHALDLPLPKQVYVHGMLLAADGKKMSKSLGNTVDPYTLINNYSNDLLRYYLLRSVPSGQDGRFAIEDLIARNNNELANDFGNLALRVIKLAIKRYGASVAPSGGSPDFDGQALHAEVAACMDAREHHRALDRIWEFIKQANTYLNTHEPWRIKNDEARVHHLLYNSLYAVHCMSTLLLAFIPQAAQKTLMMLGQSADDFTDLGFGKHVFALSANEAPFPKIET